MAITLFGLGNALVDLEYQVNENYLEQNNINKGIMSLLDIEQYQNHHNLLTKNHQVEKSSSGGSAANSLVVFSQLGGTCHYSCRVANDTLGDFYHKDLQSQNVSCEPTFAQGITGQCLVLVTSDAERTMLTHLGVTANLCKDDLNPTILKQSQWLFFEGYTVSTSSSFEAVKEAIQIAKQNNVSVAMSFSDPSMVKFFHNEVSELVSLGINCLFANEEEVQLWAENDNLSHVFQLLKKSCDKVVVTQGDQGVTIYNSEDQSVIQCPASQSNLVDSNGSGDAFAGAFLYGITQGWTDTKTARLANRIAAQTVSQFGARLPKTTVEKILSEISIS